MKFLANILIFAGYTLIYAAVARQGELATDPWGALLFDVYETPEAQIPGSPTQGQKKGSEPDSGLFGINGPITKALGNLLKQFGRGHGEPIQPVTVGTAKNR